MRVWLERPSDVSGHDWRVKKQTVCDECAEPEFHYEPHRAAPKFTTPPELVQVHASLSSSQFRADLVWEHGDSAADASCEDAPIIGCDLRHEIAMAVDFVCNGSLAHEVDNWA